MKRRLEHQNHSTYCFPSEADGYQNYTRRGHPVNLGRTYSFLALWLSIQVSLHALTHFNAALSLFEQFDCQREIANVCCNIGDIHLRKTEHELAQSFFDVRCIWQNMLVIFH